MTPVIEFTQPFCIVYCSWPDFARFYKDWEDRSSVNGKFCMRAEFRCQTATFTI